ncbi:MAG: hypothetical protein M0P30_06485, partial [Syntrophorhabdaceae bacterium]|nr:hypothetical protein [Syntrophorhabdaceae bacterium]
PTRPAQRSLPTFPGQAPFPPLAYIAPRDARDTREFLRHRASLVSARTSLKNKAHAVLDKNGIRISRPRISSARRSYRDYMAFQSGNATTSRLTGISTLWKPAACPSGKPTRT